MKSISLILITVFHLAISMQAYSATKLNVQDPRQTWRYDTGSVEDAVLTVKPSGALVEYSLTMTFSSRGTSMTGMYDTIEIQYFFDLPENSLMVDAWLWIEDTVMQARLLDKGRATLIYEGIVKRRRDPLILYKQSQTSYEMRIFPLAGNSTRKARFTWLQPMTWNATNVLASLPLHLINCGRNKPAESIVMIYNDNHWKNVAITDNPNLKISDGDDPEFGLCKMTAIPYYELGRNCTIAYDNPATNGVFVSAYEEKANEGYYSMVLQPSKALAFYTKKKILFLVDYDAAKSDLTRQEVIDNLKGSIIANLTPSDSFNIIFSNNHPTAVSSDWIGASPAEVNALFDNLQPGVLSYYSLLPSIIIAAAEFVKSNNYDCSILLIANSDGLAGNKSANPLIEEYTSVAGQYVPFNIIDFSTKYRIIYPMNNYNYSGNEYLYKFLSESTGGFFLDIMKTGYTLQGILSQGFKMLEGQINSFEMYPSVTNGFCYGRYLLSGSNTSYSSMPVVQLGKWVGDMPFTVTATGFFRNEAFSKKIDINYDDINWIGKRIKQQWSGIYLKTLETGTKTNEKVAEAVNLSINARVLSIYTAFLALEPERQQQEDEEDDDGQTYVDNDIESGIVSVKCYPNPFTDKIVFNLTLSNQDVTIESVEIINALGNKVRTIADGELNSNTIAWEGCDNSGMPLPGGLYIVRFRTNKGIYTTKVMLIR